MLRGTSEDRDGELAFSLASRTLRRYSDGACLLKAFEAAAGNDAKLRRAAVSLRLHGPAGFLGSKDAGEVAELVRLVAAGVDGGANAGKSLELFIGRLESETRMRNRFRARVGSSLALTRMGMGFFFPLFAGISSIILVSVGGLGGGGAQVSAPGFVAVCMLYVAAILYLSAGFAHPEKGAIRNLSSIVPYLLLASLVTLITRSFLSGVL